MPVAQPSIDNFKERIVVDPLSGCWLWTGSLDKCGYAKMNAKPDGFLKRETLAHRFSFSYFNKTKIPKYLEIDHICFVRNCVNPEHLRLLTHAENVKRSDHKANHRNAVKTHCKRGHLLEGENLYTEMYLGKRTRHCRKCRSILKKTRYQIKKRREPYAKT